MRNLLKLDYRNFEIVIVDDGSTDNTKQLLTDTFGLKREADRPIRYVVNCKPIKEVYTGKAGRIPLLLISKENGKHKADANNAAINVISYPYFVCMDADEVLQSDALKYASRAILEDDNVIGVGGNIKISNSIYRFTYISECDQLQPDNFRRIWCLQEICCCRGWRL